MRKKMRLLALSIIILYLIILYAPIVVSVLGSFSPRRFIIDLDQLTLEWYYKAFSNKDIISATENSIKLSILSGLISALTGLAVGYAYISRRPRGFVETIVYMPILIPEVIESFTLALFYIDLGIEMGFATVLIGHLTFNIAYAFVIIRSRVELIPREIVETAKILGATDRVILLRVIMPLSYPAIISAFLLTFAMSFDDLIKTLFTSGPGFKTLPIVIWSMVGRGGITPEINAVNSLILLISLSTAIILSYSMRREIARILG
ncbi:MAG: ABC transporter permease [Sulfolobales archaeon]